MRKGAGTRAESKRESLDRILDAAARRIREEGLDGAAIVPVMRDAGLTHGAFYSHFSSKDDLANAAFTHAITTGRRSGSSRDAASLGGPVHRPGQAVSHHRPSRRPLHQLRIRDAELGRRPRVTLTSAPVTSMNCGGHCPRSATGTTRRLDDAIALMTVCVGGMSLARAVVDPKLSARILRVARDTAAKLADTQPN